MSENKVKVKPVIQVDDYDSEEPHGEIEIFWDLPNFPMKWSARHLKWILRLGTNDSEENQDWSESEVVEVEKTISIWNPCKMILEHFSLQNTEILPEEILKLGSDYLELLKDGSLKHYKTCECGSNTYCKHSVGSSGCDPVDDFRLICPICGELDQYVHVDMGNDQETCPWCDGKAS